MQPGTVAMGAGLTLLALMTHGAGTTAGIWTHFPGELPAGAGMGLALPPLFSFLLAAVTDSEVGFASGVLSAAQQLGAALGIAVFGTVFFTYVQGHAAPVAMGDVTLWTLIPSGVCMLAIFGLPHRPRAVRP